MRQAAPENSQGLQHPRAFCPAAPLLQVQLPEVWRYGELTGSHELDHERRIVRGENPQAPENQGTAPADPVVARQAAETKEAVFETHPADCP